MTFFLSLFSHKNLRNGENVLEIIDSVEDSKYKKEKFNFYKNIRSISSYLLFFYFLSKQHKKIVNKQQKNKSHRGNVNDVGRLIVTNLRVMWFSLQNPKLTLCKNEKISEASLSFPYT